jgi:RNA polymerase sigma factor (sigma-70 family)
MFSSKMFAICLRYSRDQDEAKDNLQEGFIRVFGNLSSFKGTGSFEGWIRKIMINTALENYRKYRKLFSLDEDRGEEDLVYVDPIEGNITADELIRIIQDLTPQYRMVFNLYALEGYSHKEISQMLGISEGTSKSNLSRARTILQEKLRMFKDKGF